MKVDPKSITDFTLSLITAAVLGATASGTTALAAQQESKAQQQSGMSQPQDQQAQSKQGESHSVTGALAQALPDQYKLSNWIGKQVKNESGEQLGTVKDLVMDDFGIVRYVIMQRTEDRENDKRVAVPMGHVQFPLSKEAGLVLNVTPKQMKEAPHFADSSWPNMGNTQWSTLIVTYWLPKEDQAAVTGDQGGAQGKSSQQGEDVKAGTFDANRDMVYLSEERNQMFQKLDQNDDAAIVREEAKANERLAEQFDELDSYQNERLTRSEFAMFEIQENNQGKESKEK